MSHVALASGFGCVRRFNAAIFTTYHRTPTQIRRIARQTTKLPKNEYLFRLSFRPPYHWKAMLASLAYRAIPGVESVKLENYCRSISLNGSHGYFEVSLDKSNKTLNVRVQFEDPLSLFTIIKRIKAMFDLAADWSTIAAKLRVDPTLKQSIKANPGIRVPGCWDGFELVIRAILDQNKSATTLTGRIVSTFGRPFSAANTLTHLFPLPEDLAEAKLEPLGLSHAQAKTIRSLARAVCKRKIRLEGDVKSDDLLMQLCEIPGIESSTAQYVVMRTLREPDAFPSGDLDLQHVLGLSRSCELELRAEAWRPWRSYAAMYLWAIARD